MADFDSGPISVQTQTTQLLIGPGDVFPTTPYVWWGLRAYSAATRGTLAVRLRRNSDQATQDFATDSFTGRLNTAAITSFAGGAGLTVTILYDQTGNRNHATISTGGTEPSFSLSGPGSTYAIDGALTGNDGWLVSPALTINQGGNGGVAAPFTLMMVAQRTTGTAFNTVMGTNTGVIQLGYHDANSAYFLYNASPDNFEVTASDNAYHAVAAAQNASQINLRMNVDGGSNSTFGPNTVNGWLINNVIALGGWPQNAGGTTVGNALHGNYLEAGFWLSDATTLLPQMTAQAKVFWGF